MRRSDLWKELMGLADSLDDSVSPADAAFQFRKLADEVETNGEWESEDV